MVEQLAVDLVEQKVDYLAVIKVVSLVDKTVFDLVVPLVELLAC